MGGDDGAAGRRGRWMVPSASESGLLACSFLQGPPVLKPHPQPTACFQAQHCPPASALFTPETPEEFELRVNSKFKSFSESSWLCDGGNWTRLTVTVSAFLPLVATRYRWAWGWGTSPDLDWETPGDRTSPLFLLLGALGRAQ